MGCYTFLIFAIAGLFDYEFYTGIFCSTVQVVYPLIGFGRGCKTKKINRSLFIIIYYLIIVSDVVSNETKILLTLTDDSWNHHTDLFPLSGGSERW